MRDQGTEIPRDIHPCRILPHQLLEHARCLRQIPLACQRLRQRQPGRPASDFVQIDCLTITFDSFVHFPTRMVQAADGAQQLRLGRDVVTRETLPRHVGEDQRLIVHRLTHRIFRQKQGGVRMRHVLLKRLEEASRKLFCCSLITSDLGTTAHHLDHPHTDACHHTPRIQLQGPSERLLRFAHIAETVLARADRPPHLCRTFWTLPQRLLVQRQTCLVFLLRKLKPRQCQRPGHTFLPTIPGLDRQTKLLPGRPHVTREQRDVPQPQMRQHLPPVDPSRLIIVVGCLVRQAPPLRLTFVSGRVRRPSLLQVHISQETHRLHP
mmetsp:Transcript_10096/g.27504  ORF Transcript_10096/g.27504 Transcript_10096/m.27504 type:complete len:322 (+) Transcript_10096:2690-3655(+)